MSDDRRRPDADISPSHGLSCSSRAAAEPALPISIPSPLSRIAGVGSSGEEHCSVQDAAIRRPGRLPGRAYHPALPRPGRCQRPKVRRLRGLGRSSRLAGSSHCLPTQVPPKRCSNRRAWRSRSATPRRKGKPRRPDTLPSSQGTSRVTCRGKVREVAAEGVAAEEGHFRRQLAVRRVSAPILLGRRRTKVRGVIVARHDGWARGGNRRSQSASTRRWKPAPCLAVPVLLKDPPHAAVAARRTTRRRPRVARNRES